MSYSKVNWINHVTPLNATNLNHMDDEIYLQSIRLDELPELAAVDGEYVIKQLNRKMVLSTGSAQSTDYDVLQNKPQINSVTLISNKSFDDLGLYSISYDDIDDILEM